MLEEAKPLITEHHLLMGFTNYAGPVRSRFLVELRDNKRIMGIKCNQCNLVYVPPRPNCVRCMSDLHEWVEVSDKGTLTTYTVVYATEPMHKKETPFVFGIIHLDGADTGLVHFLNEIDPEQVRMGARVQAVFSETRTGSMLDIAHFKPL
ncbi:Zn-ribbon domain-containing OB-fold protein [Chloroflexota bacterium]